MCDIYVHIANTKQLIYVHIANIKQLICWCSVPLSVIPIKPNIHSSMGVFACVLAPPRAHAHTCVHDILMTYGAGC